MRRRSRSCRSTTTSARPTRRRSAKALPAAGYEIVADVAHEATSDLSNEVTQLLAAGPDVIIGGTTSTFCTSLMTLARQGGFTGPIINSYTCQSIQQFMVPAGEAAANVFTLVVAKDPSDPAYADDAAVKQYLADVGTYGPGIDATVGNVFTGYNAGVLRGRCAHACSGDGRWAHPSEPDERLLVVRPRGTDRNRRHRSCRRHDRCLHLRVRRHGRVRPGRTDLQGRRRRRRSTSKAKAGSTRADRSAATTGSTGIAPVGPVVCYERATWRRAWAMASSSVSKRWCSWARWSSVPTAWRTLRCRGRNPVSRTVIASRFEFADDLAESLRAGRVENLYSRKAQDHDFHVRHSGEFGQEPLGGPEEQRAVESVDDDVLVEKPSLFHIGDRLVEARGARSRHRCFGRRGAEPTTPQPPRRSRRRR